QLDARAGEPRVPGRRARRRRGPGRRGGHLPGAGAARPRGVHAAHVSPGRGGRVTVGSPLRRAAAAVAHRTVILGFIAFAIFPFYWVVIPPFKQNADLCAGATNVQHDPFFLNLPPTLDPLRPLLGQPRYPPWLFNPLLGGVVVVLATLALAVPAG